jgi:tetratricopeptide (TPR) repeat protein
MRRTSQRVLGSFLVLFASGGITSAALADPCAAVKREMTYGRVALEDAKDKAGFLKSAALFETAARKAPECAQAFFNMGLVYEKAGEYGKALAAMTSYLRLAPNAPDKADVETKIFELEYRGRQQVEAKAHDDRAIAALRDGTWCPENQFRAYGAACAKRRHNSGLANIQMSVNGSRFNMFIDWQNQSSQTYAGTVSGRNLAGKMSIGHQAYADANCSNLVDFTGEISADGNRIVITKRQYKKFHHCKVLEWGPMEEVVFVRVR